MSTNANVTRQTLDQIPKIGEGHSIVNVIRDCMDTMEPILFNIENVSFVGTIVSVNDDSVVIEHPIGPEYAHWAAGLSTMSLSCKSYLMQECKFQIVGRNIRFLLPEFADRIQDRMHERTNFIGDDENYVLLKHPIDADTFLRRRLFDLSEGGFSFRSTTQSKLMVPNRHLPNIEIHVRDCPPARYAGRVIYVRKILELAAEMSFQIGVQFTQKDPGV